MPVVTFEGRPGGIRVAAGTTILEAARQNALPLAAPCGGSGKCGKCRVLANGQEVLACRTTVEADVHVSLPREGTPRILTDAAAAETAAAPMAGGHLAAFDIGTTTVVCYLMNPAGQELAVESMANPQAPWGADVVSRLQRALAGEADALTRAIRAGTRDLLAGCCRKAGITPERIGVISVVGNPCMQQLFLGLPVDNLAAVPFAPVLTEPRVEPAGGIFPECPGAALLTVPDISGYVGADTVACVLASRLDEGEDTTLLVDIGTNGEMVLTHRGRMAACSTAAGPALEGAGLTWGMGGRDGAIDHVWTENGAIRCSVIGGGKAAGICGSGVIDAVAALLELGLVNSRGRIQSTAEAGGQRFVRLTDEICLTQEDIRRVQMAKGAIAAGIHLLCGRFGITPADIRRVILAGAFGSFLDPGNACRIGLLPRELAGRITAAGNLAGAGARIMAVNRERFARSGEICRRVELIQLAQCPDFQRTFARCMML